METNISMQKLKEQRLTPAEKFVLETIKGAKACEQDKYGDVEWYKGGVFLIGQTFRRGYFWVSHQHIRSVLRGEYGLKDDDIKQLLAKLLHKYTNNGQLKIIG
jgi:hypothetical protein